MEKVLAGFQWKVALVYLDDVLVFAGTIEEELQHLEVVLGRLKEANLKLPVRRA